jgi:predicted permease
MALGSFFYFRTHIATEQALSIAQFVIINASIAMFKVWWAMFFDYRDSRGAFVVIMFATFFNVGAAVIAGVVAEQSPALGWASFALLVFHVLVLAYLTVMSWNWQVRTGMTRKQARALDIESSRRQTQGVYN